MSRNGSAHIVPATKKQFRVRYMGANNKILSVSETLTSIANCHTNIAAHVRMSNGNGIAVKEFNPDYTSKDYFVNANGDTSDHLASVRLPIEAVNPPDEFDAPRIENIDDEPKQY